MRITENQLRRIIRKELLREAEEEDKDFDPEGLAIPAGLKKLLDPDISPAKYADLDAELDATGSPQHQAFALVAFALSYADNNEKGAVELLNKAKSIVPKITKQIEKQKEKANSEENTEE